MTFRLTHRMPYFEKPSTHGKRKGLDRGETFDLAQTKHGIHRIN